MTFNIGYVLDKWFFDVRRIPFLDEEEDCFWDWMGPKGSSTVYGVTTLGAGETKAKL